MKKKILVTGAAGYIGSSLINNYINKFNFFGLDVKKKKSKFFFLDKKAVYIKSNILNENKIVEVIKKNKIEIVIHLAALIDATKSDIYRNKYYLNNFQGTKNIVNAINKTDVKCLIFSSSCAVYGNKQKNFLENMMLNPINYYGKTKLLSENFIKKKLNINKKFFILRFLNVLGTIDQANCGPVNSNCKSFLVKLIENKIKNKPKIYLFGDSFMTKDGSAIREYIHLKDLIILIKKLVCNYKNLKSDIFNCGNGMGYTNYYLINRVQKLLKFKYKILIKKKRKNEIAISKSSIQKIKRKLEWKPHFKNLDNMILTTHKWLLKIK